MTQLSVTHGFLEIIELKTARTRRQVSLQINRPSRSYGKPLSYSYFHARNVEQLVQHCCQVKADHKNLAN